VSLGDAGGYPTGAGQGRSGHTVRCDRARSRAADLISGEPSTPSSPGEAARRGTGAASTAPTLRTTVPVSHEGSPASLPVRTRSVGARRPAAARPQRFLDSRRLRARPLGRGLPCAWGPSTPASPSRPQGSGHARPSASSPGSSSSSSSSGRAA
jgi:hypothetical protein